tara:strand:- start:583 stop:891 length:309 start_codon:yes stop_codon:yes gene_type:complete
MSTSFFCSPSLSPSFSFAVEKNSQEKEERRKRRRKRRKGFRSRLGFALLLVFFFITVCCVMVVVLVVVEFFTKAVRDLFGATEEKKVRAFTESQNTTTFERR